MKKLKVNNTPPRLDRRVEQMLSDVTLDMRLEMTLYATEIARKALTDALDLTTEIIDGNIPEIAGLDDKILDALSAIDEVLDENFNISSNKRIMRRMIRYVNRYMEDTE